MLKRFYRLKRQKGVVLFMVIAIMTLLIAMATTAYMTARSSYKTVVSNYDFSQTYLSALSISDMLVEAIVQDTSRSDNDFSFLKSEVKKVVNSGTAKATITSKNINSTMSDDAIIAAAGADPMIPGTIDAFKCVVEQLGTSTDSNGLTVTYISLTTTAYYRGGSITVQDTVVHKGGTESSDKFNTFFTATGKSAESGKNFDTSRFVAIDTHMISDDAFFEAKYTLLGSIDETGAVGHSHNAELSGGIQTAKDCNLYVYKTDCNNIPAPTPYVDASGAIAWKDRNDWFIGGDLVYLNKNANINLKGSNIYINGDLVLFSKCDLAADNIYVNGNIYLLSSETGAECVLTGNLFLNGKVYKSAAPADSTDPNWSKDPGHIKELYADSGNKYDLHSGTSYYKNNTAGGNLKVTGTHKEYYIDEHGEVKSNDVENKVTVTDSAKLNSSFNGTNINVDSGFNINKAQIYSSTKVLLDKDGKVVTDTSAATQYAERGTTTTFGEATSEKSERHNFGNYTAAQTVYDNILDIDFDELNGRSFPTNGAYDSASNVVDKGGNTYFMGLDEWGNKVTDLSAAKKIYLITGATHYTGWVSGVEQEVASSIKGGTYYEVSLDDYNSKSVAEIIADADKKYDFNADSSSNYKLYTKDDEGNWDTGVTKSTASVSSLEFTSTNGDVAKVTRDGSGFIVDLPYNSDGYSLGLFNLTNNDKMTYNIKTMPNEIKDGKITKDNTMAIVLRANMDDGTGYAADSKGLNAFSWVGDKNGTNGEKKKVILLDKDGGSDIDKTGSVFFEIGNYVYEYEKNDDGTYKKDADGNLIVSEIKYAPYDTKYGDTIKTPTYYEIQKLLIGTKNQVDYLSGFGDGAFQPDTNAKSMLDSSKGDAQPQANYANKIVISSNRNGNSPPAVDGRTDNHIFCGYLYIPNGNYNTSPRSGADTPIFGGMIVSSYTAGKDYFVYCAPDPQMIASMFSKYGYDTASDVDLWSTAEGKNYMG